MAFLVASEGVLFGFAIAAGKISLMDFYLFFEQFISEKSCHFCLLQVPLLFSYHRIT